MRVAAILMLWSAPALAQEAGPLTLPGNAVLTTEVAEPFGRYALPTGPFADGAVPTDAVDGAVLRQAWRIDGSGIATAQLLTPLAAQLTDQGFELTYECDTDTCGGFDFRFGTDVLPPPGMFVDLGAFRFLSARRATGEAASVLVSRAPTAGFVQIVRVSPARLAAPDASEPDGGNLRTPGALPDDFATALESEGRVVLTDLDFESGSADLGPGPHGSLVALAAYLRANAGARVALVGHTDAVGALDGNIALSRRRAASVVERLATTYAIPRAQLDAQGMGYLAPVASNLTAEGREANRRVEVILISP